MSNKKIVEVQPPSWIPSNRVGFLPWVSKTFARTKYGEKDPAAKIDCVGPPENEECEAVPKSKQRFFPHQKITRDMIQYDSPYRGLLLFHELGTGKSATSIAAAEIFTARHRKVHILVPASLQQNYREEIRKYAGIGKGFRGTWTEVKIDPTSTDGKEKEAFRIINRIHRLPASHFKTKDNKAWIPYVPDDFPKEYIVREVSYKELSAADKKQVEKTIEDIIDTRYNFINYNGLTLSKVNAMNAQTFDNSFVVIDEAHNFIRLIANNSTIARKLYRYLTEAKDMKLVLLSGTPIINHPYEIGLMLNLLRGAIISHELSILKNSDTPDIYKIQQLLQEHDIWKYIDTVDLSPDNSALHVTLFPSHYVRSTNANANQTMLERLTNTSDHYTPDKILDKIRTAVASHLKLGKRTKENIYSAFPPKKEDFDAMFLDQSNPLQPTVKNTDLFMRRSMGLVSYLKTVGEEFFPRVSPRVIKRIPLTDNSFLRYAEVRNKEIRMDEKRIKRQLAKGSLGMMDQDDPIVYKAFSRMACNFTFPEKINRIYPGDIKKILKREIATVEDTDINEQVEEENGKQDISAKTKQNYELHKQEIMNALLENADKYMTVSKLHSMYSSKLAEVVHDIETSPGKTLVYSQFREIEGLGVLQVALIAEDWIEIDIERKGKEYVIVSAEQVLHPSFNRRRYIVFSEDREKTKMLLQLYNGQHENLPQSIQDQLKKYNHFNKNMYGDLISLLMITASATEGISLKCVRRVLILEPFWNMVRMDQVIGRAVRAGSHTALPEQDRTVDVFVYVATFTDKQLKNDFTLKTKDSGLSSDESILAVAERKHNIIQQFQTMLKSAATDCIIHSKKNQPLQQGFQCYSFPVNIDDDQFAYIPDIAMDQVNSSFRNVRERIIKPQAVLVKNKKYIAHGVPPQLYDYIAYTEAGVLIPADV